MSISINELLTHLTFSDDGYSGPLNPIEPTTEPIPSIDLSDYFTTFHHDIANERDEMTIVGNDVLEPNRPSIIAAHTTIVKELIEQGMQDEQIPYNEIYRAIYAKLGLLDRYEQHKAKGGKKSFLSSL